MLNFLNRRFMLGWAVGFATACLAAVLLLALPVGLRAAPPNPLASPILSVPLPLTLQSLQNEIDGLNAVDTRQNGYIGNLQAQIKALQVKIDALSKSQVDALSKSQAAAGVLRQAFCSHNHIIEYANRDQPTFGLIDNNTGQRPSICNI